MAETNGMSLEKKLQKLENIKKRVYIIETCLHKPISILHVIPLDCKLF